MHPRDCAGRNLLRELHGLGQRAGDHPADLHLDGFGYRGGCDAGQDALQVRRDLHRHLQGEGEHEEVPLDEAGGEVDELHQSQRLEVLVVPGDHPRQALRPQEAHPQGWTTLEAGQGGRWQDRKPLLQPRR